MAKQSILRLIPHIYVSDSTTDKTPASARNAAATPAPSSTRSSPSSPPLSSAGRRPPAPGGATPDALKLYPASELAERAFCGTCGSFMYRSRKGGGYVYIAVGTIDPPSGRAARQA